LIYEVRTLQERRAAFAAGSQIRCVDVTKSLIDMTEVEGALIGED
jgi:hypothetical protein